MRPAPELGDTLLVNGRPAVVVALLPGRHRHEATARCAYDLPCEWCGTPLSYSGAHQGGDVSAVACSTATAPWPSWPVRIAEIRS